MGLLHYNEGQQLMIHVQYNGGHQLTTHYWISTLKDNN